MSLTAGVVVSAIGMSSSGISTFSLPITLTLTLRNSADRPDVPNLSQLPQPQRHHSPGDERDETNANFLPETRPPSTRIAKLFQDHNRRRTRPREGTRSGSMS